MTNIFAHKMSIATSAKAQRGVTLMELIAGLAVMSVIVVGAVSLYSSATSSTGTGKRSSPST